MLLHAIVRENLETFLAAARTSYARPIPAYVERELRGYLRCGIHSEGFVRCHCDGCGLDLLVALSCKGRGICPSCGTRRMTNTAAHLVDRVLPDVPVRQYVLSALSRTFIERLFASYGARARSLGIDRGQPGAVAFVQRFGGSLNLHVPPIAPNGRRGSDSS
jgi:hypothetical protein